MRKWIPAILVGLLAGSSYLPAQTTGPSGDATGGSGTLNTIPLWSAPTVLGDSIITESSGEISIAGSLKVSNILNLKRENTQVVISAGVITATSTYHRVDTEASAATDDLDTINSGGTAGEILIIVAAVNSRTVVLKEGTGNLNIGADCTLNNAEDTWMGITTSVDTWLQLACNDNGP